MEIIQSEAAEPSFKKLQEFSPEDFRNPVKRIKFLSDLGKFLMWSGMSSAVAQTGLSMLIDSEVRKGTYEASKYEPMPPLVLTGKRFRLVGVSHDPKTFELNEQDTERRVDNAPFVLLEYFHNDISRISIPSADIKNLPEQKYNDLVYKFYGGIGKICAIKGKDIICVNPENAFSQELDLYVLFGVPGALAITDAEYLIKKFGSKPVSRRHFLKLIAYGAAGLTWATWTGLTRQMRKNLENAGVMPSDLPDQEKADILGWNLIDWRDLKSSQGVRTAFENFGQEISSTQEVPMFQGSGHNGILEYLKDPQLVERKDKLYAHQNLVGSNSVRRFSFNRGSNKWELTKEISY